MKPQSLLFLSLLLLVLATSCNGQSSALDKAQKVQKAIEDAPRPGTMPSKAGEWTLKATIDGKAWSASSLMPPEAASRIIGYYKDDYMALPSPEKRYVKVGWKSTLRDDYPADISFGNDPALYSGHTGEMVVTAINGDWIEGSFYFTATSTTNTKKIAVTNGYFKVKLIK